MMPRSRWFCWVAIPCLIVPSVLSAHLSAAAVPPKPPSQSASQHVTATMLRMPLQFEANHGQVDAPVKFMARGKGYTLLLTPTESVVVLQQRETTVSKNPRGITDLTALPDTPAAKQAVVRMKLEGANQAPMIDGMEKLPGIVNYFIGNDPKKWHTEIPTYAKVQYQEAYPGIDLAYYGNQGKLEYDFIVAPEADPNQITLTFEGASDVTLADSGDLLLTTALGEVRMQKPVVYQLDPHGHKTLVAGQYVVGEHRTAFFERDIRIELAAYDRAKPLVIDPVLLFSTFLGGNGNDGAADIARDSNGNLYISGVTTSADFPLLNAIQTTYGGGNFDVFVTKVNASGTIQYSTYLGGSGVDYGNGAAFPGTVPGPGIAVDAAGNAYVAGTTQSGDFPTLNAYQATNGGPLAQQISDDVFLTKLGPTGALVYSTYLGEPSSDYGNDVAVDANQNAYVTGQAQGLFPTGGTTEGLVVAGNYDAFVAKFNATGSLVYSRFLGGALFDGGRGIAADATGNAYVIGDTNSLDFPILNASQTSGDFNFQNAFVAKLDTQGVRAWSTYLGGTAREYGLGIAVDGSGNVYVTGETNSADFPTLNASQPTGGGDFTVGVFDAFVTKYSSSGSRVYSTYLGGNTYDSGSGIAADPSGNAYVTGQTASADFPTLNASQPTYGGTSAPGSNTDRGDAFVTKFNTVGARVYSTYLGGDNFERGNGIAVDGSGNAYVVGTTGSSGFPLVNPTQSSISGYDAFVAKLGEPTTNSPPVCTNAQPSVSSLWKADKTMVSISILGVTDPNNDPITITYPAVTQDEPLSGLARRDLSPDAAVNSQQILLRAERDQKGDGRVYVVHFTATDNQNSSCSGTVQVQVPLNKKNSTAVDSGQIYNSFGP